MIVNRAPTAMWLIASASFILCLSTPAYLATINALTSRGMGLAWYHRVGVAALCLVTAYAAMLLPGLLALATRWIARGRRVRPSGRS